MERTAMPERPGRARASSFEEVNLGYTDQLAVLEASGCIQCPHPARIEGCPVGVRINELVAAVAEERFDEAEVIVSRDSSTSPAST